MKMWKGKGLLAAFAVCLCLFCGTVPAGAGVAYGASAEGQAAEAAVENAAGTTENTGDADAFVFICMGGLLLVLIVAVVAAVGTVSAASGIGEEIE
ncbi:MAG: hypothetical protein HFE83_10190 [Lachnospiraceae bacterium]|jgi:hypothetical protein|nr:hypothetical protein [Lachnospiraceae bacterium]